MTTANQRNACFFSPVWCVLREAVGGVCSNSPKLSLATSPLYLSSNVLAGGYYPQFIVVSDDFTEKAERWMLVISDFESILCNINVSVHVYVHYVNNFMTQVQEVVKQLISTNPNLPTKVKILLYFLNKKSNIF